MGYGALPYCSGCRLSRRALYGFTAGYSACGELWHASQRMPMLSVRVLYSSDASLVHRLNADGLSAGFLKLTWQVRQSGSCCQGTRGATSVVARLPERCMPAEARRGVLALFRVEQRRGVAVHRAVAVDAVDAGLPVNAAREARGALAPAGWQSTQFSAPRAACTAHADRVSRRKGSAVSVALRCQRGSAWQFWQRAGLRVSRGQGAMCRCCGRASRELTLQYRLKFQNSCSIASRPVAVAAAHLRRNWRHRLCRHQDFR